MNSYISDKVNYQEALIIELRPITTNQQKDLFNFIFLLVKLSTVSSHLIFTFLNLSQFLNPSPKNKKKITLKTLFIFFQKTFFSYLGMTANQAAKWKNSYTLGWLLIKGRSKEFLIMQDNCRVGLLCLANFLKLETK